MRNVKVILLNGFEYTGSVEKEDNTSIKIRIDTNEVIVLNKRSIEDIKEMEQ